MSLKAFFFLLLLKDEIILDLPDIKYKDRVEYISPDTIVEQNVRGEEYFFKVLISLDNSDLMTKKGTSIDITTGMGAQADIITGSRTVLHYIAKPIIKVLDESFTER